MTAATPSGVVTFLFTDIEGSTRRWEADPQAVRAALVVHYEVLRAAIGKHPRFV
jgi:class 3 adenylate cyclase